MKIAEKKKEAINKAELIENINLVDKKKNRITQKILELIF